MSAQRGRSGGRRALLELLGITGLAVTQPVLDVFARSADVLVQVSAGGAEIVGFALVVAVVPALVLFGIECLVGLIGERPRRVFHDVVLVVLVAGFAVQLAKDLTGTGFGSKSLTAVGLLVGAAFAVLVWKVPAVRSWLRVLAVGPIVFVGLFLSRPDVADVAFGSRSQEAVDVTVGRPAPVVLIVLDELPTASLLDADDAIDAVRYPHLAGLAADATWYRNHTTVSSYTETALPAILTGRMPEDVDTPPVAASHPESLFTLLGRSYEVHAAERITQLCPTTLCRDQTAEGDGLRWLLPRSAKVWGQLAWPSRARQTIDFSSDVSSSADRSAELTRARSFAARLEAPSDRPRLDVIHLMVPHAPWELLPSGQRYETPKKTFGSGIVFNGFWSDQRRAGLSHHRHLLQAQATDVAIGGILDRLRTVGAYDESLVIVTADHGVSFDEREPFRGVTESNHPEILWTPLLIKPPGPHDGTTVDAPVRSIDIVPTIADHLGVDIPWEVDGQSARARGRSEGDRLVVLEDERGDLEAEDGFATVDGRAGYLRMLDVDLPLATDDPALVGYQWGEHGRLVGRRVSGLPTVDRARVSGGSFDDGTRFEVADLESPTLPVAVSGVVSVVGSEALTLAVAVDGVIGATAETVDEDGGDRRSFAAILAPSLLHEGDNELALYAVDGRPGSERLQPVRVD